jgi:transcriptional regulator with XRE-family HTH domain
MKFYREKVKRYHKESGMTAKQIAEKAGISPPTFQSWKSGTRTPKEANIRNLAKALNVKVSQISNLKDKKAEKTVDGISSLNSSFIPFIDNRGMQLLKQQEEIFKKSLQINKEFLMTSTIIKTLIDSIDIIFYVKNINQKYIIANKSLLKHADLPFEYNAVNKTDYDIYPKNDARDNTKEDQWVINNRKPVINREGFLFGSRKTKRGLYSKFPIFDSNNQTTGVVGIINNITKRQSEIDPLGVLEIAIDHMNKSAIIVKNNPELHVYHAVFTDKIYGHNPSYLKENPEVWLSKCIHPDDKSKILNAINSVKEYKPQTANYRIIDSSGNIKNIKGKFIYSDYTPRKPYIVILEEVIKV